ncbi:hypothetical protein B4135_0579 [Caldibacillus debilis]|uniref:Uncharacterized protein n=1 Tax=Caldibacillus debilis TaxID=301148 RepID=A0A150M9K9_9BACI|nr:hypothetical protein B4135_0579 [Caldibacillus debilis]
MCKKGAKRSISGKAMFPYRERDFTKWADLVAQSSPFLGFRRGKQTDFTAAERTAAAGRSRVERGEKREILARTASPFV